MGERAVIRVQAVGLVFGDRPGIDPDEGVTTVIVMPGTPGTLVTIGSDGFRVIWDRGYLATDDDGVAEVLRHVEVDSEFEQDGFVQPGDLLVVSADPVDPVAATIDALDDDLDDEADDEDWFPVVGEPVRHRASGKAMTVVRSYTDDDGDVVFDLRWSDGTICDLYRLDEIEPMGDDDPLPGLDIDAVIDGALDDDPEFESLLDDVVDRLVARVKAEARRRVGGEVRP